LEKITEDDQYAGGDYLRKSGIDKEYFNKEFQKGVIKNKVNKI
jgi:hypothetical protein